MVMNIAILALERHGSPVVLDTYTKSCVILGFTFSFHNGVLGSWDIRVGFRDRLSIDIKEYNERVCHCAVIPFSRQPAS